MTYPVHSIEQDMAGKWYARVLISAEQAMFFKFHEYPSEEQVQEVASAYVASMEAAAGDP
jgi:hypothetical protein